MNDYPVSTTTEATVPFFCFAAFLGPVRDMYDVRAPCSLPTSRFDHVAVSSSLRNCFELHPSSLMSTTCSLQDTLRIGHFVFAHHRYKSLWLLGYLQSFICRLPTGGKERKRPKSLVHPGHRSETVSGVHWPSVA